MIHIKRFFLIGKIKFIGLISVWLLISSHTNLLAQNYYSENESRYPFLWNILELYCYYNLSGPKDMNGLIDFIDLSEPIYAKSFHYKTIRDITIPNLLNNENEIRIINNDCEYALILCDTLLYSYDSFPCCDVVEEYYLEEQPLILEKKIEKGLFFFKNRKPIFAKEDLILSLVKELKTFYKESDIEREGIVFLGFLKEGHLFDYCKSNINLNNSYYNGIEKLLRNFCIKHDVDEIYLHVYCERTN